jgi:GR25 family glycosyltransferase involved in LPS biosynthesis
MVLFDTYVINMDSQKSRWEAQSKALDGIGINPIRIPGVLITDQDVSGYIDDNFTKFCKYTCPYSAIGITASHKKACSEFLKTDNSVALILEDDAYPLFDDVEILDQYLMSLPPADSWDMWSLHCDIKCSSNKLDLVKNTSAAAYFISRVGAERVLNYKFPYHYDIVSTFHFKKRVAERNFFWTDERSIKAGPNDVSTNRQTNRFNHENPINKWISKKLISRGEKDVIDILEYKIIRIPFTNITLSYINLVVYIIIILYAYYYIRYV